MRIVSTAAALLLLCGTAIAQTAPPAACAALMQLQVQGVALTVTKTEWFPAGTTPPAGPGGGASATKLPAYCRLDGVIDRRTGAAGATYGIGFALALPENWNGRFLFQGGGGLNGSVQPPIGGSAAGSQPGLARGFAVVSTDTGHQGRGGFDATFRQDQQASLDFAYAAVGRVTEVAKRIIAQHYGKPADRSYFAGCSTGGREAMLMAQRYPMHFDGIVAGAPAMRTSFSGIGDRGVAATLNEIAPKDEKGLPIPRNALSEGDKKAFIDGLLNACDAADGLKDGMIFNTSCRFDPKTLVCKGAKADGCLSMPQATTIEKAFAGPKDSKGRQVYPGFLFDTGIVSTQGIPGLLHGGSTPVGPAFTDIGMDVDSAVERALADPAESLSTTSRWTNLNTFSEHGGKLIFWHGVSDPWFSALDTIDYYERITNANGGPGQVRNWSRLFLSPGMGHCGGGPTTLDTFDAVTAIVRWVEQGIAPESLTATGRAFPSRSRPLCAYPLRAHYKGQGNPEDAANFECR
jgi:Tannase and feruloyl esterase